MERERLRRTWGALATATAVVVGVVGAGGAAASEVREVTYEVAGTFYQVFVDTHPDDVELDHDHDAHQDVLVPMLEVDGQMYDLPEALVDTDMVSGEGVVVSVQSHGDLTPDEALAAATDPTGPEAQLVEVAPALEDAPLGAGDGEGTLLAAPAGRTLTILPVHFGSPDAATNASLTNLAESTRQYWSEQSAGQLAMTTDVRNWKTITDPGSCNTTSIWNQALTAHGLTGSRPSTHHIAVYFPVRADCGGWAGMASVGGTTIWINGSQARDVLAHEFGHNLGLGHANTRTCTSNGARVPLSGACTAKEYADHADVMGIGMSMASGNLNTALADHLGMATVTRIAGTTSSQTVTVDLHPMASVSQMRAVAVTVPLGTVYVEFRPNAGRDVRRPAWAGVQVRLRSTAKGYPESFLLDMQAPATNAFSAPNLPAGGVWRIPGSSLALRVESIGQRARVVVGPADSDAVARYVTRVYLDLFERQPDPSGLATWTDALRAGTPRVAVANAVTGSEEYRSRLITASYKAFLGRSPDPSGLQHWLGHMRAGMTIQEMEAGFLASPEYYLGSGSNDRRWVTRLYGHVLDRAPGASEVTFWRQQLAGGMSRHAVSLGFLLSTEYLTTVVDGHYRHLLGRSIDPTGRRDWVSQIQRGVRVEAIIGGIISSDEYYARR
ncbi:DUF4214 domain-containing protein [Actinotalea sp. K2]|uniref:DUF4214 domain-containing protein n=1 Tax=Actinotalea sp. K2 TaxID=2939438 RepID=UPI002016BBEA|nr:DUF4214 domain-containing protein [Actinotalea sp. K2]MCL3862700.1 DUF4214 domain-containing protein [Actinotalea sp. K2]